MSFLNTLHTCLLGYYQTEFTIVLTIHIIDVCDHYQATNMIQAY
jgi:hypothetical protein